MTSRALSLAIVAFVSCATPEPRAPETPSAGDAAPPLDASTPPDASPPAKTAAASDRYALCYASGDPVAVLRCYELVGCTALVLDLEPSRKRCSFSVEECPLLQKAFEDAADQAKARHASSAFAAPVLGFRSGSATSATLIVRGTSTTVELPGPPGFVTLLADLERRCR